jgi:hypothetical protein
MELPGEGYLFIFCFWGCGRMRHRHAAYPVPLAAAALSAAARRAGAFCATLLSSSSATLKRLKTLLVTCSNRGVSISLGCSRRSGDPPVVYLISADLGGSQTFFALHLPR